MTAPGPTPTAFPDAPPAAPPLLRRRDDRVLRGVCAAVGRTTDTDPVLWRVIIGVLTVFGGTGLLLYAAGWLLIPEQGEQESLAERALRGRALRPLSLAGLVLGGALLLGVVLLGLSDDGNGVVPALIAALLVYVLLRRAPGRVRLADTEERTAPPSDWVHGAPAKGVGAYGAPAQLGWRPDDTTPGAWLPGDLPPDRPQPWETQPWEPQPWTPPLPRRRSALGLLTLSTALLVTGALLGLHAAGVGGITVGRVLAADLLVLGLGLLVGARWGRARWLVLPAALLAVALVATTSAQMPITLSAGERTWLATDGTDHRLGAGEAVLDLRGLDPAAPTTVSAQLGVGELRILVPAGLHVRLDVDLAAGEITLPGEPDPVEGTRLDVSRDYGPPEAPLVRVDVRMGAGELEVRYV